ncbi:hypothetical protein ACE6H2_024720 [Prunus campanulata]
MAPVQPAARANKVVQANLSKNEASHTAESRRNRGFLCCTPIARRSSIRWKEDKFFPIKGAWPGEEEEGQREEWGLKG